MATLKQLKKELRLRLGEPTEGRWSYATDYDTNVATSESVDELKLCIEAAEEKVAEDCTQEERPLLQGVAKISVQVGVYRYPLPSDFLSMKLLQHYHLGNYYTVVSGSVSLLFDDFDPSQTDSGPFVNYDIQGITSVILAEGVATGGSVTTLVDTKGNGFGVPVVDVDIIRNFRDKSSAIITTVAATTLTFSSGLAGGRTNSFRAGDRYQVESAEESRQVLWVYPPLADSDAALVSSDAGAVTGTLTIDSATSPTRSFTLTEPTVLYSSKINLASISTESQPIRLEIQTVAGALASTNPESVAAIDVPVVGDNEAFFEAGIELAAGTYQIVASTIESASYAWNRSVSGGLYKLYEMTGDESLVMTYARYPRKYSAGTVGDAETSEVPLLAKEAVLLWAEHLAYLKLRGRRSPDAADARRLYEIEIERVQRRMRIQAETGFTTVKMVGSRGSGIGLHNIRLPIGSGDTIVRSN